MRGSRRGDSAEIYGLGLAQRRWLMFTFPGPPGILTPLICLRCVSPGPQRTPFCLPLRRQTATVVTTANTFVAFTSSSRLCTKWCLVICNLYSGSHYCPRRHSLKARLAGIKPLAQRHTTDEWCARPQIQVEVLNCCAVLPLTSVFGWL